MRGLRTAALAALLCGGTAGLAAQQDSGSALGAEAPQPVDRVVAVVGNHPILASQIQEELFARQSQGTQLPTDSVQLDSLRRRILSDLVDDELLVEAAQRDTAIKVTPDEVAQAVEQQVKNIRSKYASELDYTADLKSAGFASADDYRRWLTEQQRRALLRNRLLEELRNNGRIKPVAPTEAEMRTFYNAQKGQLGQLPATISFRQIVVAPRPSDTARAQARALADSIAVALRAGADFATAAKRFSQDPGSREQGGELGWHRRGTFERNFDRAVFSLKPGTISDPVETSFGYHIIQVERIQPTEVQARHILIVPATTPAEADTARALAERIASLVRGGAAFDSLQAIYHDPAEEKQADLVPLDKLPEAYTKAVGSADSGAVVGPFPLAGPDGRTKFAVLMVTARRPAGTVAFDDVKDRIRQILGDDLGTRRYLTALRAASYVDIRPTS